MRNNMRGGFTIIELLIVIVIIAILAAITIVSYNGIQNRSKESSAKSFLAQVMKKVSIWQVGNPSTSPSSLAVVDVGNTDRLSYRYTAGENGAYCVSAHINPVTYYVNPPMLTTPTAGSCAGHSFDSGTGVASYRETVLDDSPIAYYRLGDNAESVMLDASGGGRTGELEAGYQLVGGIVNGSQSALNTSSAGAIYQPDVSWHSPHISAEVWIQTTSTNTTMRVLSRWESTSSSRRWIVLESSASDSMRVAMHITGQGDEVRLTASGLNFRDGNPHHIVVTFDGTDQKMYFDGALVASQARPGSLTDANGTLPFRIGRYGNNTSTRWQGVVDEVALYDYALSLEQVQAHYVAGKIE